MTNKDIKTACGYIVELSEEASDIGEDGDMCCAASSLEKAFEKFKQTVANRCGDEDAAALSIDSISMGYLFLVKDLPAGERRGEIADCEWFVSAMPKEQSPFEVWIYRY